MPPTKLAIPLQTSFNATTTGDNTLVAAAADHKIAVVGFIITSVSGTGSVTITNGAAGAVLARFGLVSSTLTALPQSDDPWFETGAGTALILNKGANPNVGGCILYHLIPKEDIT